MTAGDIKGEETVFIYGTLGATTTLGQVVHLESDGYWDPVVDTDTGKFGVALKAGDSGVEVPILIWGRVEVTATGTAIKKGAIVMGGDTGCVAVTDNGAVGENVGMAMEAFDASGNGTVWIGLVA